MSAFKDMVEQDIHNVFLNADEFADLRTVVYDGVTYTDIPIILTGLREQDRAARTGDNERILYRGISILHCAKSDLGDSVPEKGRYIEINDEEGGEGFFTTYTVVKSICEMGMIRCELEMIGE